MSDDEEKKETCVVVLIGNDDVKEDEEEDDDDEEDGDDEEDDNETQEEEDGVKIARACAQRLYDVLSHTSMFSGHQVCGDPILLLDKSKKEIMEGIQKAVQLVKDHNACWLIIYYAGHSFYDFTVTQEISFCDLDTEEIVITPKADGDGMKLQKQVKKTVRSAKIEDLETTIFLDGCLRLQKAEDDNQLGDSKNVQQNEELPRNEDFKLVRACDFGFPLRDGCLFARAIERCARESFDTLDVLIQYVQEFAWQLSCGRLCPWSKCPEKRKFLVLSRPERRKGLLEKLHFLPFALDLRTEDKLDLDPQTLDRLDIEGSDIVEVVKMLKSIFKELDAKKAAFEDPWCELEAIADPDSGSRLEDILKYLQRCEIPDRNIRPPALIPVNLQNLLIPDNVRRAIVEVLQKKVKPKFDLVGKKRDPDFQWKGLNTLRDLMQDLGQWYDIWEPRDSSETGTCKFLLDKEKKAYSVVVEDLDVIKLEEKEMKELADHINKWCKDLGIPGRVYLVPGSLWIIFCLNGELSRDLRREFAASLKSWIDQQKQSGANGWTLARDPCWKPLHAVPDRILELVRQVETLCATCLPTRPMWLRASDLRNLVAKQLNAMRERKLEEWRVVVFEGLMERRGDSWLQGTGTLGCCLLPHFEDERLDHRMQEVANLACKRKRSMRPEVQALVFLLQRAQLELTDEEWTQVVDSARVCYERLKTVLRKVMIDKDTDLICGMNDIIDDSDWELVDSGPVKDTENPSGSTGRDAAAAATAANNSSGSDDQVSQVFPHGWNSGLNHIADQQAWSPSSRQAFLSSEGLIAFFHEISSRF